ncbi:MAG: hypothetical protein JSV72_15755, partial [Ralstonia sp.]
GGESREATTKSELTTRPVRTKPAAGESGGVLLVRVLPPDRHGNAVTGYSAGRHQLWCGKGFFHQAGAVWINHVAPALNSVLPAARSTLADLADVIFGSRPARWDSGACCFCRAGCPATCLAL